MNITSLLANIAQHWPTSSLFDENRGRRKLISTLAVLSSNIQIGLLCCATEEHRTQPRNSRLAKQHNYAAISVIVWGGVGGHKPITCLHCSVFTGNSHRTVEPPRCFQNRVNPVTAPSHPIADAAVSMAAAAHRHYIRCLCCCYWILRHCCSATIDPHIHRWVLGYRLGAAASVVFSRREKESMIKRHLRTLL